MICNVLCVGTELLLGQIDDTNSTYIGQQLADSGIRSFEHRRVGDNHERIAIAVTEMLLSADALIVTGGLGPTHDDITREVLADIMGVTLEKDNSIVENMEKFFAKRNRVMPENNIRQAMVPVGADLMRNPLGTAPGLVCPLKVAGKEKTVFLLPGVPHEMHFMMNEYVMPLLREMSDSNAIVTKTIKTWGLGESVLAEKLDELVQLGEHGDVKVGFLARGINGIYVKLSTSDSTVESALEKIEPVQRRVEDIVGDFIYAYDDETMESVVIDLLRERKANISIAESLTGGLVMSRLVDVPGASDVLAGGVVAYTTDRKRDVLNVNVEDVYSHDCAIQMAIGVRDKFDSSFALSTTGVAGPGDIDGHKAGEVYVGMFDGNRCVSKQFLVGGDRLRVREYTTISALDMFRRMLLGLPIEGLASN